MDVSTRMSLVKQKNTNIELLVRKFLFSKGFRYKINDSSLPGKPDIVLPKFKTVVFVNGCFWHGHNCHRAKLPNNNLNYWKEKIMRNMTRDNERYQELKELGWYIIIVWQCELKNVKMRDERLFLLTKQISNNIN